MVLKLEDFKIILGVIHTNVIKRKQMKDTWDIAKIINVHMHITYM